MTAIQQTQPPPLGGARAWLVWLIAALAFGYAFFHRVAPSVMVSDLMSEFAIGGAMLGTLSALYFYPYVLMQVPLGVLIDRFGTRILLGSALTIAGLGSILFATTDSLNGAYAGRILIGIGSAVGFLGSLALAARWFPRNRFAFLSGLVMFFGMGSGMLAQAPLAYFVEQFGWRSSMWSLGVAGLLLAAAAFLIVRNSPGATGQSASSGAQSWREMRQGLRVGLTSREVWKIALVAAAMSGPMLTIGGLWGTPYLMVAYGLERPQAAFLVSLLLLGWAIGAPASGWLSDWTARRKEMLVVGSLLLAASLSVIVFFPNLPLWLCVAMLIGTGLFGAGMSTSFALVRSVAPPEIAGTVTGIVNAMTVASGAALQPLVGLVLDLSWDGTMTAGSRIYRTEDYRLAFGLVLASAVIGLITAIMLRDPRSD